MGIRFHTRISSQHASRLVAPLKNTRSLVWFAGIFAITLATTNLGARGIQHATDTLNENAVTPSVNSASQTFSVVAEAQQGTGNTNSSNTLPEDTPASDQSFKGTSVSVSASDYGKPEVTVNGNNIDLNDKPHVHKTVTTADGIARVDVSTNDSTGSSSGDKNQSSTSTSLRVSSSSTTRQRTTTSN